MIFWKSADDWEALMYISPKYCVRCGKRAEELQMSVCAACRKAQEEQEVAEEALLLTAMMGALF